MTGLADALTANRAEIEREIGRAEEELGVLRQRERELEDLVHRARVTLGIESSPPPMAPIWLSGNKRLTLHDAMLVVLRSQGDRGMTATELAEAVNEARLYAKRDGSPVDPAQIYARTHNYSKLFERADGRIRARRSV